MYNGLVLMDVGNLADREEAVEVKRLASLAPQTMAAFVGSSGKSVKILVPFVLPDGSLPEKRELRWPTGVQWPFIRLICNVI